MSTIFLRIYGGLLFTLVLVAALSGLALTIINGVRLQEFRESAARGTFQVMAMELSSMPRNRWPIYLERWENQLGIDLTTLPAGDSVLGERTRSQLDAGRVLVRDGDNDNFEIFTAINDNTLLRGSIIDLNGQLATGTGALIRDWLATLPAARRLLVLQDEAAQMFSYPIHLFNTLPAHLNQRQQGQLLQGHTIAMFNQSGRSIDVYSYLDDTEQTLYIGPVAILDPYPFQLLATIALFGLASISIAIYILVRGLERRLSKLEWAAVRLARGDLDTRVKLHGRDSVGQLATAFNNMATHIQRLLSIQKEMIRGISHELRTPVARVRFGLEMVVEADNRADRESHMTGIDRDIEELDHLIDEILTYAQLEEGIPDIRFQRLDVENIASRVVEEHQRQKSHVTMTYIPSGMQEQRRHIDVEERYIHRAIQNLVSNACRYADKKVEVRFSVGHDNCRIDVDDDGPGIPEDQRERVFTAFARLDDSRTRSSGGYGLGLSIVRRIMHWHNGKTLITTSERLGGARFSLVWPRRQRSR